MGYASFHVNSAFTRLTLNKFFLHTNSIANIYSTYLTGSNNFMYHIFFGGNYDQFVV